MHRNRTSINPGLQDQDQTIDLRNEGRMAHKVNPKNIDSRSAIFYSQVHSGESRERGPGDPGRGEIRGASRGKQIELPYIRKNTFPAFAGRVNNLRIGGPDDGQAIGRELVREILEDQDLGWMKAPNIIDPKKTISTALIISDRGTQTEDDKMHLAKN